MLNLNKFGLYPFNPNVGQKIQSQVADILGDAAFLYHMSISAIDAIVSDTNAIKADIVALIDNPVVVETLITNPTIVRNITATVKGTVGDVKAVQVLIEGTNVNNEVISESLPAFTVDTLGTKIGTKAFKTVTKITVPAMDGAGVIVDIGFGEVVGLPFKLSHNTLFASFKNNVKEVTDSTVLFDSAHFENNTIKLNSAFDGTVVDVYFMV